MTDVNILGGRRVLVVEDNYFLASDAARALKQAGAEILGPYPSEQAAYDELERERPEAAVLDINFGAGASFRLAGTLRERHIPFLFVTGYDRETIPPQFSDVERLTKPVLLTRVVEALSKLLPH